MKLDPAPAKPLSSDEANKVLDDGLILIRGMYGAGAGTNPTLHGTPAPILYTVEAIIGTYNTFGDGSDETESWMVSTNPKMIGLLQKVAYLYQYGLSYRPTILPYEFFRGDGLTAANEPYKTKRWDGWGMQFKSSRFVALPTKKYLMSKHQIEVWTKLNPERR